MRISVIIPYYNREDLLLNILKSFQLQTINKDEYEIVIIDDGSNENIDHKIKALQPNINISYNYFQRNSKSCAALARNRGIEKSKGEILIFLDCDQIVYPDFLEEHLYPFDKFGNNNNILQFGLRKYMNKTISYDPGQQIITNKTDFGDDSRHYVFQIFSHNMSILKSKWHLVFSNNISTSKKVIDKFGGFDDNFRGWGLEDTEFGYRLYKNGVKIIYNPNIEVIHQYHEYSFDDKRYTEWNRNFEYFIKKHPDIPVLLQGILKDFFDPDKRAVKEQKGIQHVWLHSYIKFENALRCLDDKPAIKTGSSDVTLIRPDIDEIEKIQDADDKVYQVICFKDKDRDLLYWMQLYNTNPNIKLYAI